MNHRSRSIFKLHSDFEIPIEYSDLYMKHYFKSEPLHMITEKNVSKLLFSEQKKTKNWRTSQVSFPSQVDPPGSEDVNMMYLKNLVSYENNQLDLLLQSGDSKTAINLAAVMASVLNHMSENSTTEGNQTAAEKAIEDDKKRDIDGVREEHWYSSVLRS